MKKATIIIAAYQAHSSILACARSLRSQRKMTGWEYEIRIGVDGCPTTAAALHKARIPFYWSRQNVGTYVMANSLIALGPADIYVRFDADDFMMPGYMQTMIPVASKYGIAQAAYRVGGSKYSKPRVGQVAFTAATLNLLGGFHAYRCHCDRDFSRRAMMAGLDIKGMRECRLLARPLFVKGYNPNSITHCSKFGCGSSYRKRVRREMKALRDQGQIKIIPKTIELKRA